MVQWLTDPQHAPPPATSSPPCAPSPTTSTPANDRWRHVYSAFDEAGMVTMTDKLPWAHQATRITNVIL
jgi:hypothetical protein